MIDERVVEIQKGVDEIHHSFTAKNVIALPGSFQQCILKFLHIIKRMIFVYSHFIVGMKMCYGQTPSTVHVYKKMMNHNILLILLIP